MKNKLKNFIQSRYGMDEFNYFLMAFAILFLLLFFAAGEVFLWEAIIVFLLMVYRACSGEIGTRIAENDVCLRTLRFIKINFFRMSEEKEKTNGFFSRLSKKIRIKQEEKKLNAKERSKNKYVNINVSREGKKELLERKKQKALEDKIKHDEEKAYIKKKKQEQQEKKKNEQEIIKKAKAEGYIIIKCPNCAQKMRIAAHKGKISINCPKCKNSFVKKK